MRALIIPFFVAVLAAGCGGTGFTAGVTQTIAFRLGPVSQTCSATGATTTVPHSDGSQTAFTHQVSGSSCVMSVQWRGPVIDMAKLRSEIARDEPDANKDMSGIKIEHFDVDLNTLKMADASNNHTLNVADTVFQQYDLQLNLDDGTPFIALHFINDNFGHGPGESSNPDHAQKIISNEAHVMDVLNANLKSGTVGGTGTATMKADKTRLDGFANAQEPAIQFHLDYDVSGGAHQG